ncbi:TetR/AcrR family transcriptional regulator [Amycolatopsis thermalba]|uniref:TetR/AcrR family transcriptional regulator n=1 Tax=Amycolatopsis thermalba TaxID=944492 RepID=UPI001967C331|nr:helix-turn-helix domain-containing protein [Amycolatopsis thermalba]
MLHARTAAHDDLLRNYRHAPCRTDQPRRRGAARTDELLQATLDLATEAGYAGLNIEAVALRAGVGKHTIYRRWLSMAAILLDALSRVWTTDLDYHDAGDVRADLRVRVLRSAPALSQPPIGRCTAR